MGSLSLLNNLFKITIICTSTVIVVGTIVFTKEVLCEGLTSEKKKRWLKVNYNTFNIKL